MAARPNAPSFYAQAMSEERQRLLERARRMKGLDEDIALARVELRKATERIPRDDRLVIAWTNALRSLELARHQMGGASEDDRLERSLFHVLHLFDENPPEYPGTGFDASSGEDRFHQTISRSDKA